MPAADLSFDLPIMMRRVGEAASLRRPPNSRMDIPPLYDDAPRQAGYRAAKSISIGVPTLFCEAEGNIMSDGNREQTTKTPGSQSGGRHGSGLHEFERRPPSLRNDPRVRSHDAWVGKRVTDREMIHHLSLLWRQVQIVVHFIVEKCADSCCP